LERLLPGLAHRCIDISLVGCIRPHDRGRDIMHDVVTHTDVRAVRHAQTVADVGVTDVGRTDIASISVHRTEVTCAGVNGEGVHGYAVDGDGVNRAGEHRAEGAHVGVNGVRAHPSDSADIAIVAVDVDRIEAAAGERADSIVVDNG